LKQGMILGRWLRPGWYHLAISRPLAVMPGPICRYDGMCRPEKFGKPLDLAVGHLLSHVQQETTVGFFNATHQPAELVQ